MKLPRDVNGPTAKRALQKFGFIAMRQVGSHLIMKKGETTVVVPQHSDPLRVGTLARILKQAEITPAEFVNLL